MMRASAGFPWLSAVAGAGLLVLSLATVRVRGEAVSCGYDIARRGHVCEALDRRLRHLELRFETVYCRLGETGAARL